MAESVSHELERELERIDLEVVSAAFDAERRRALLAERCRVVRKIETVKNLERAKNENDD